MSTKSSTKLNIYTFVFLSAFAVVIALSIYKFLVQYKFSTPDTGSTTRTTQSMGWQQYTSAKSGFKIEYPSSATPDNLLYGVEEGESINFLETRLDGCQSSKCIKVSLNISSGDLAHNSLDQKYKGVSFVQKKQVGELNGVRTISSLNGNGEEFYTIKIKTSNRVYFMEVGFYGDGEEAVNKMLASFKPIS